MKTPTAAALPALALKRAARSCAHAAEAEKDERKCSELIATAMLFDSLAALQVLQWQLTKEQEARAAADLAAMEG